VGPGEALADDIVADLFATGSDDEGQLEPEVRLLFLMGKRQPYEFLHQLGGAFTPRVVAEVGRWL